MALPESREPGGAGDDLSGIDIHDPDRYVAGPPHADFARLRRSAPVFRQPTPDGGFYWAVTRHADVVAVSTDPATYSSARGSVMIEDLEPEILEMTRSMLLVMDPPAHGRYRRMVLHAFTPRMVEALEPRIRALSRAILESAAEKEELEFVHDVAAELPVQVIGELMGIPAQDRPRLRDWAEQLTGNQDPDVNPGGNEAEASFAMGAYAVGLAGERRGKAGDDLTTTIVNAEVDGHVMNDFEFGAFFVQMVTAGNDTSKTSISSAVDVLLDHPAALAALREDASRIPAAVEEVLRYANPLHYFRRTATRDTTLRGTPIREGDKVVLLYTSANRDEEVFADPNRFDISRSPNPHLAFGFGEHFCVGAKLARLEARIFLEELLSRFARIERTGPARRQRSNLNNALKSLPLVVG
ncbi:MAG: cytochrome P450 [Candidatus Binatia bacterium]